MNVELILLVFFFAIAVVSVVTWFTQSEQPADVPLDLYLNKATIQGPRESTRYLIDRHLRLLDIGMGSLPFLALLTLAALSVGLLTLEFGATRIKIGALVALAILIVWVLGVREVATTKVNRFEAKLLDALDLMQAALQGGETPQSAIITTGNASNGMIKHEFTELGRSLALGMPIDRASARMLDLYDSEGVRMFVQALRVKWQVGGDLADLMKSANRIIRARVMLRIKLASQLSGAKYASILVAIAPYAVVPFFLANNPAWLDTLSNHPLGPRFLMGAILLQIIGLLWLRRIQGTR
jgi:tight adherence protein B